MPLAPEKVTTADQILQDLTVPSFFSLPREIRDKIYHLVVGVEGNFSQSRECHIREIPQHLISYMREIDLWPTCDRLNIARTCRIANEEANEVIYKKNKFRFYAMSRQWLRPQISQKNADMMQNIAILFQSDKTSGSGLGSVEWLQMFTLSQIVRKVGRIAVGHDLDKHEDLAVLLPVTKALLSFTVFQEVIVGLVGKTFLFLQCECPEHVRARSEWKQIREDLESALGPPETPSDDDIPLFLTFKPREYLTQNGLSS